ncbi:MAG: alkaline phosphatase [Planctomycetales bacterium]|nr:alkaline phosphatase [Planctomycetales bacterium]
MRIPRVWLVLAAGGALLAAAAPVPQPAPSQARARHVIVLFADGAALSQWELARAVGETVPGTPPLAFHAELAPAASLGMLQTEAADARVTDSAASATAMFCGVRTRNGAVGVDAGGRPVGSVLEEAHRRGYRVGIVTTTEVTDASPAAQVAHVRSRDLDDEIVRQIVNAPDERAGGTRPHPFIAETGWLDVVLGGGAKRFPPAALEALARAGFPPPVRDRAGLAAAAGPRILGLFARGDLEFEVDRAPDTTEPTLSEMAEAAIRALSADPARPFYLFVESEATDTAGHGNDARALVEALRELDRALAIALRFRREHPEDTLVIVTADHETGGLSHTGNVRPPVGPGLAALSRPRPSLRRIADTVGGAGTPEEAADRAREALGLTGELPAGEGVALRAGAPASAARDGKRPERNRALRLAELDSRRTGVAFGTSGHTSEPVPVLALGPGAERFAGFYPNTGFRERLEAALLPPPEGK